MKRQHGADRVAVAFGARQAKLDKVRLRKLVWKEVSSVIEIVDDQIELAPQPSQQITKETTKADAKGSHE